jgi:hypothetical protein
MSVRASGVDVVTRVILANKVYQGEILVACDKFGNTAKMNADGLAAGIWSSGNTEYKMGYLQSLGSVSGFESHLSDRLGHTQYYA